MSKKHGSKDRDIISSAPAMLRAARAARTLALKTGTPFYVMQEGKIINLNSAQWRQKSRTTDLKKRQKQRRVTPR